MPKQHRDRSLILRASRALMLLVGVGGAMRLAPTDLKVLQGLPIQGYHLAAFLAIPVLLTLGLVLFSRRFFGKEISPCRPQTYLEAQPSI